MIKWPEMQEGSKTTLMTTTFTGYNHNQIIKDGEMFDTLNMSGDMFPILSLRKKRGYTYFDAAGKNPPLTGIEGREKLAFCLGKKVYWDWQEVPGLAVSKDKSMLPKKIVSFGAYVCIWPDKVYFNTFDLSDCGSMERLFPATGTFSGTGVSLAMCRGDGTNYDMTAITVSSTPPEDPDNGDLWIDQSGSVDVLRQYASSSQEWVEVASTYVKVTASNIGKGLSVYDTVDISGLDVLSGVSGKVKTQVQGLNGSHIVYGAGDSYFIVAGLLSSTQLALKDQPVRADRKVPDMDYITESNNRLWGCRYGEENGQMINEIRASALGDFRNWSRFLGNSQDSYVMSVGSRGPFTAAVTQKSYPVFFKENCIHTVYGNGPSSFQLSTTACRGVQDGSWRSALVVNELVYYKSRSDVMMFDGSMPVSISTQLGNTLYSDARAGALGDKYYISMKDRNNQWHMFTFNSATNAWFREDDFRALGFGRVGDELFAIDEAHNRLAALGGSAGDLEEDFPWMADFGLYGTDWRQQKYLSRFDIRMYLEDGARAELSIMYDSDGEWHGMGTIRGNKLGTRVIPVIPRRCDHLRFRISGEGECRIYAISRILEVGSDG